MALDAGRHPPGQAARLRAGRRHAGVRPARQPGVVDGQLRAVRPARAAPDDGRTRPTCWTGPGSGPSPTRACARRPDGKLHLARVVGRLRRRRPLPRPLVGRPGVQPAAGHGPGQRPGRAARRRRRSRPAATSKCCCCLGRRLGVMAEALVDPFGRTVRDLRISVTDRCNFRCAYCMPEEGMEWLPRDELLTFEEIERVARVCVERFGFDGHPPHRRRADRPGPPAGAGRASWPTSGVDLAMTTNGATLPLLAADLRQAGLRRINISLRLAAPRPVRWPSPGATPSTRCSTASTPPWTPGFDPVKVNCVLMRGVNDDEIVDFAAFGRERGVVVRFIEFMPLDASGEWGRDQVVPAAEVVAAIDAGVPAGPGGRAGRPAGRAVRVPRRRRRGRGDRQRDPARSAPPATGSGSPPRACSATACSRSGDRPAGHPARRRAPTTTWPRPSRPTWRRKWAGHSIGQVHFIQPDADA